MCIKDANSSLSNIYSCKVLAVVVTYFIDEPDPVHEFTLANDFGTSRLIKSLIYLNQMIKSFIMCATVFSTYCYLCGSIFHCWQN